MRTLFSAEEHTQIDAFKANLAAYELLSTMINQLRSTVVSPTQAQRRLYSIYLQTSYELITTHLTVIPVATMNTIIEQLTNQHFFYNAITSVDLNPEDINWNGEPLTQQATDKLDNLYASIDSESEDEPEEDTDSDATLTDTDPEDDGFNSSDECQDIFTAGPRSP